jgi:hypothetical protein
MRGQYKVGDSYSPMIGLLAVNLVPDGVFDGFTGKKSRA